MLLANLLACCLQIPALFMVMRRIDGMTDNRRTKFCRLGLARLRLFLSLAASRFFSSCFPCEIAESEFGIRAALKAPVRCSRRRRMQSGRRTST